MSDQPPHGLELLEWIKVVGSAAASAVGAAWAFLRGAREELDAKITAMGDRVNDLSATQLQHHTDVAVLKANADNNVKRLDEIKDFVQDVNSSVKALSEQLTEVLMEMKTRRP